MKKIDDEIQAALDRCGRPYDVKEGSRHLKLFVGGKFIGILPRDGGHRDSGRRNTLNLISQIRRAAAGLPSNRRNECA